MIQRMGIKLNLILSFCSWALESVQDPSLPLIPGLFWPWVVAPVKVPSMDKIDLDVHFLF